MSMLLVNKANNASNLSLIPMDNTEMQEIAGGWKLSTKLIVLGAVIGGVAALIAGPFAVPFVILGVGLAIAGDLYAGKGL